MSEIDEQTKGEMEVSARIQGLAKELAEAAASLWTWGDGCGGWVRQVVEDAFDARGLGGDRTRVRPAGRAMLSVDLRAYVFARDGMRCMRCGSTESLTVDHVIPVIHGGSDEVGNLQTLCRSCNSKKGAR
jgi:hypothetical protein